MNKKGEGRRQRRAGFTLWRLPSGGYSDKDLSGAICDFDLYFAEYFDLYLAKF